jgi:hypothetical protein
MAAEAFDANFAIPPRLHNLRQAVGVILVALVYLSAHRRFRVTSMEVLSWLEDSAFEWDMFVDLPENTIRYCFRTLDDATAFKRRFGEEKRAMLA